MNIEYAILYYIWHKYGLLILKVKCLCGGHHTFSGVIIRKTRAHEHNMYTLNSACFFKKYNEDKMVKKEKVILFLIIYHIE